MQLHKITYSGIESIQLLLSNCCNSSYSNAIFTGLYFGIVQQHVIASTFNIPDVSVFKTEYLQGK